MAWAEAYGQGYVHAIDWFLHKFKIDLFTDILAGFSFNKVFNKTISGRRRTLLLKIDLVDTLRAFKAAARFMCPATVPLLNPTAADIPLS